jgi:hypothetical protein
MNIDSTLRAQIERSFAPLKRQAAGSFPAIGALSKALADSATAKSKVPYSITLTPTVAAMFAKAGVDTWMRAVHSFLVSAALTDVSPIWASVAGYYSSHYSVRAFAHVFGFFQLYGVKQKAQLDLGGNYLQCRYDPKKANDREHKIYWKVVKANPLFEKDELFTDNDSSQDPSDSGHRDLANYKDFLQTFPTFSPLDREQMRHRIQKISNIEFTSFPIPSPHKYPDVESVQIVAYHRLVRFRDLLDEVLGGGNNFWTVHRNPPWARDFIDYQLVERQLDSE